jgi:hypothetical protein
MKNVLFLTMLGLFAFSGLGFARNGGADEVREIVCVNATVPATGKAGLKCTFQEAWEYVYGSNILSVLRDTADFAQRRVGEECGKHNLEFELNSNPADTGYGTGGILNFHARQENRKWSVYAKVSGEFYCVKKADLARNQ